MAFTDKTLKLVNFSTYSKMLFFYFECTSYAHHREIEKFFILCTKGTASRRLLLLSLHPLMMNLHTLFMTTADLQGEREGEREREQVYIIPH